MHSRTFMMAIAVLVTILQPMAASAASVTPDQCIQVNRIDHTRVVDDQTILFYLVGGKVLKNALNDRCFGLKMSTRGYTYVARNDEVCGNLQSIKVNDTGNICELGPFSAYTPAPTP